MISFFEIRRPLLWPSRRGLLNLAAILMVGFNAPALVALDPSKSIGEYGRDLWQSEQGLPHNSVRAVAQTPDGYLWVATTAGIARFDGAEFQLLGKLGADAAMSLAVSRSGGLWVGTIEIGRAHV